MTGQSTAANIHITQNIQNEKTNYLCCIKMQVKNWEICPVQWSYIKGLLFPLLSTHFTFPL